MRTETLEKATTIVDNLVARAKTKTGLVELLTGDAVCQMGYRMPSQEWDEMIVEIRRQLQEKL